MTDIQNQTGTKKKLLIPVVVLMLLGVSLAGAAYAYSSTLTLSGNNADAAYVSIDLRGHTPASDIVTVNSGVIVFTDKTDYAGDTKYVKVDCDVTTKAVKKYQLTVDTDLVAPKKPTAITITSTGLNAILATPTITDKTLADSFKVYVNTSASMDGAVELTDSGVELTVGEGIASFDVYLIVVGMNNGVTTAMDVTTETTVKARSTDTTHNAAYFAGVVNGSFTLEFKAEPAA